MARAYDRRQFLSVVSRGGIGLAAVGGSSALLAACGSDGDKNAGPAGTPSSSPSASLAEFSPARLKQAQAATQAQARALVGDVVDFKLTSDEWTGVFGYVVLRLHRGLVDGKDVFFVRTDASDRAYAEREKLVFVPRLAVLNKPDLSGEAFFITGGVAGQPPVLSSEPGRPDWTPAWRVSQVAWIKAPRLLRSAREVEQARTAGEVRVTRTPVVLNAAIVKWSAGELAVDTERTSYLGPGQLLAPPDTRALTVRFKLHECFPNSRYIVTDHSIAPAAEMTKTIFAPRLQGGPSQAGATGRTNVFMNGVKGTGPMGFQPSAFDWPAGDPAWSPYWDHYTYAWKDGKTPRLLTSQSAIHAARDAGELTEFPGVPDTKGEVFTVNCPVPVAAPNVFSG